MLRIVRDHESAPAAENTTASPDSLAPLAAAARDGDVRAARTLLVAIAPTIFRSVRGVLGAGHPDVEDIAQDAALALLESLPTFRGECSVRHFAARIAVLKSINARRQSRFRARWTASTPMEGEFEFAAQGMSPAQL